MCFIFLILYIYIYIYLFIYLFIYFTKPYLSASEDSAVCSNVQCKCYTFPGMPRCENAGNQCLPGVEAGRMNGERDRFGKQDAEKWKQRLCHSVAVRIKMKWSLWKYNEMMHLMLLDSKADAQ